MGTPIQNILNPSRAAVRAVGVDTTRAAASLSDGVVATGQATGSAAAKSPAVAVLVLGLASVGGLVAMRFIFKGAIS